MSNFRLGTLGFISLDIPGESPGECKDNTKKEFGSTGEQQCVNFSNLIYIHKKMKTSQMHLKVVLVN